MIRVLWLAVIVLAIFGVAAAMGRAVFVTDWVLRAEPTRQSILRALNREDPRALERPAELRRFDGTFAAHPVLARLHVVGGAIVLALVPLQFSTRIRSRYVRFHRWSGRGLVLSALVAGLTALYFGLLMPYGGVAEGAAIAVFGSVFLIAIVRAFVAIRRGDVARHREWMLRVLALAIGVSTIRVVGAVLDILMTPAGFHPMTIFVLSLWIGWTAMLGGAELWIRHTRTVRTR